MTRVEGSGCCWTLTLFMRISTRFGDNNLEMRWNIYPECLAPNPFWISDTPECRNPDAKRGLCLQRLGPAHVFLKHPFVVTISRHGSKNRKYI